MSLKPTVSIYELGNALGVVAGMEYAEVLTAPVEGAKFKIAGLFDAPDTDTVKSYLRDLDGAIESFSMDAQKNVTRSAFLQSLNEWLFRWKQFYGDHQTTTQILLAGRDATMTQGKEYGKKLDGWRSAYALETGKKPEGETPSTPQDKPPLVPLTTKILIGLAAAGVLGLVGYATYRYVRRAKEDVARAEGLARGYAERVISGGFPHSGAAHSGARELPHGGGHAILAEE